LNSFFVDQNSSRLLGYADDLVERSKSLGGIVDADTTLKLNKPEFALSRSIAISAADLGVDTSDIATSLRLMVGGEEEASRFRDESVKRRLRRAVASD
jgi:HAE1 family hydrophobic/amphiphilic exporter-1